MNVAAIDAGIDGLVEVNIPAAWKNAKDEPADLSHLPEFVREVVIPMNRQEGDDVPVSMYGRFNIPDGTFPSGMTKYEKRGVAVSVPRWDIGNCIQCNQCALVCPHAAIRPILVDPEEKNNAPAGFETKKPSGKAWRSTNSASKCRLTIATAAGAAPTCARRKTKP